MYFYFQKGDRVKNKFTKFSVFRNITKILALTLLSFITFLFYYKVRIISGIFLK